MCTDLQSCLLWICLSTQLDWKYLEDRNYIFFSSQGLAWHLVDICGLVSILTSCAFFLLPHSSVSQGPLICRWQKPNSNKYQLEGHLKISLEHHLSFFLLSVISCFCMLTHSWFIFFLILTWGQFFDCLERVGWGRERHWCKRETSTGCLLAHALTKDRTFNLGVLADWKLTQRPFSLWDETPTNWAALARAVQVVFFF